MFTFYDINDLLLLHLARILPSIDVPILVAEGKLKRHVAQVIMRVKDIQQKGLVNIISLDDPGFDFVLTNRKQYRAAGSSVLEMFYMCKTNHATIVVDQDETMIRDLANTFGINVCTLDEFNLATVNNQEYFQFINEMKKERMNQ